MKDTLDKLPSFTDRVHRKMLTGRKVFGDKAFSEDPIRLINEIQDELVDVAGWSYILWQRLEDMKGYLGRSKLVSLEEDDG